jgi:hypothetical protein
MSEETELLAEIAAHADRAAEAPSRAVDLRALAEVLARRFHQESIDEIEDRLTKVWQARGSSRLDPGDTNAAHIPYKDECGSLASRHCSHF